MVLLKNGRRKPPPVQTERQRIFAKLQKTRKPPREMTDSELVVFIERHLNGKPLFVSEISDLTSVPSDLIEALLAREPGLRKNWRVRAGKRGTGRRGNQQGNGCLTRSC